MLFIRRLQFYDVSTIYDNVATDPANFNTQPQVQVIAESAEKHSGPFDGARGLSAKFFNLDSFTNKLKSISRQTSTSRCARSIRLAFQSAGAKFQSHPVAAADWGDTLKTIGYRQIQPSFDNPQDGDIYIIHRTQKHKYGHIAGYSGNSWVSDFKQRSYDVYRDKNVQYSYYRLSK